MSTAYDIKPTAAEIARQLKERQIRLVERVVGHVGTEKALAYLQATQEVEASGGMLTLDGKRCRTAGGVFFYLVKQQLTGDELPLVFPPTDWKALRAKKKQPAAADKQASMQYSKPATKQARKPKEEPPPLLAWAERGPFVEQLLAARKEIGRAENVKVTLIGRSGKVIEQGGCVMTTMQGTGQAPALPKGVPAPPPTKLLYLVYIASKQWKKVAAAIRNPEDKLIVEGYLTFDPELKKMSVFAQNVTTKLLQQAKRQGTS